MDLFNIRVNVNWQEVLTVLTIDGVLCFSFHVACSPLQDLYGETLYSMLDKYPHVYLDDHFYEPGGHDQINVRLEGFDAACELLADPSFRDSIRLFNLRLMKKGPCAFSRYHCLDLADRLFIREPN